MRRLAQPWRQSNGERGACRGTYGVANQMVCSHCGGGSVRWHSHPSAGKRLCHGCCMFMGRYDGQLPELPPASERFGKWRRLPQQQPASQQPTAHQPPPPLPLPPLVEQQPQQQAEQQLGQRQSPRLLERQQRCPWPRSHMRSLTGKPERGLAPPPLPTPEASAAQPSASDRQRGSLHPVAAEAALDAGAGGTTGCVTWPPRLVQATLQPGGADGGAIGAAASAPPSAAGAAASDGQPAGHETTGSPCGWVGPGQTGGLGTAGHHATSHHHPHAWPVTVQ